jgi:Xaa-Pro aminopeptidase
MTGNHDAASRRARHEKLRELMERQNLGSLLLRRSNDFAWYTGGADNRVDHASPLGVADVLVTLDAEYVFTNNIEAPRMREEQTPNFEVVEHPWYEDDATALREVIGDAPLGTDFPLAGASDVSEDISSLRQVLDLDALKRYRGVGADAVAAVAEAAGSLEVGMSELEAAANLAAACRRRGLFNSVLLAAADDRIVRYRHPIPHGDKIERRAVLLVRAERGGFYANLTRIVHLDEPDEESKRRLEACETILRRMREEATLPSRTLADAFEDCRHISTRRRVSRASGSCTIRAARQATVRARSSRPRRRRRRYRQVRPSPGIPPSPGPRPKRPSSSPSPGPR